MSDLITIKGIREGLLVTLSEGENWMATSRTLLDRIDQASDFFTGAKLALGVGPRALSAADLGRLRDALSERKVNLWAVLSDSPTTVNAAQALGLIIHLPASTPQTRPDREVDPEEAREEAVLVRRTLRSGRSVRHTGHVIVIGDVNPGAEIVAGGDVVVWGRLRGVVHAGAGGDAEAVVCALDLSPTQLRIANHIATSPARKGEPKPEMARIRDGQIVAERWSAKK
ncbi:MAG TPA: septum site-determining protein MinC [Anaerolineales bacterium]|nr:septum site-determining protein MinC [Anaerolineales bacterium]